MPDAHEAYGQNVQEETAQELDRIKRHDAWFVTVRIIAPAEGDALAIKTKQTVI